MKRVTFIVIGLIIIAAVSAGIWWVMHPSPSSATSTDIFTSGFIEAKNVSVAFELTGRIVEINADEGDQIKTGVILAKLDDSVQQAQLRQAETAVKVAQSAIDQAVASRDQAIASHDQVIVARDGAKKAWEDALDVQKNPLELDATITQAQAQLAMAEVGLEYIKDPSIWSTIPKGPWDRAFAQQQVDGAQMILRSLLDIKNNPQTINAAVDQAEAAYQKAVAAVGVAEKAVEVVEKTVEVATAQLAQAQASLDVIKVQMNKNIVVSPVSGVVATRDAEVSEIAKPGVPILTIIELNEVTNTAYVPESKIGLVKVGQKALVSVDSYPDETFRGQVVYISPEAQFTPKNVQLKEERETTVFAIKIRIDNRELKLKPGMSADARIITDSGM